MQCDGEKRLLLTSPPLLSPHGGGPMKVPVSSGVFPLLCKRMTQAARQLGQLPGLKQLSSASDLLLFYPFCI